MPRHLLCRESSVSSALPLLFVVKPVSVVSTKQFSPHIPQFLRFMHVDMSRKEYKPVPPFVGAIDQGTSSTRFLLFDASGQIVGCHQEPLSNIFPKENDLGWVEHDPRAILSTTLSCIDGCMKELSSKHDVKPSQVKGIGITNQRETTIVWDKHTGEPLHNAIVWLDTRTQKVCRWARERCEQDHFDLKAICGLPISTYFSAFKLRWLMNKIPKVKQAIEEETCLFGTVDSWLLWNLTKESIHATDVTNASRTALMNIKTLQWDSDACKYHCFDVACKLYLGFLKYRRLYCPKSNPTRNTSEP